MIVRSRNIVRIVVGTAFLLLLPLVAMQISGEVVWSPFDFAVAGALLTGTGLTYELATSQAKKTAYRVAVGAAIATAFILVWANLAVGLIGTENNPANLMYVGVLAVALIGAAIARLEPRGMAKALFATALAQVLVAVIALTVWNPPITTGAVPVLGVNAFFAVLWVGSALLFLRANARLEVEPAG
jgi:hypothetical protein